MTNLRSVVRRFKGMGTANKVFTILITLAFLYMVIVLQVLSKPAAPPQHTDSHKDLQATDEIIVILGYKLHPDGMPSRILRDRVHRAAKLYKDMMEAGHHPLIVVSGKGKAEIGYTEAEAMLELCMMMGVREGDILVDSESENTAQNAKFSAALIANNDAIEEVYVVTSDYHLARSQYTFQTIFPRYRLHC